MSVLKTLMIVLGMLIATTAIANKRKPNIVFILADDMGWQDVGFMGSKWFETPHLDQLANESLVFNQAYMYPTCSPSRAALLTGKQAFRTDVYTVPVLEHGNDQTTIFSRWTVEDKHKVYAQPLKEAGYHSIHLGKWHIVGPYPEKETQFPFKHKLSQPESGDMSWLPKHQKDYQRYYPTGRGFDENVGGTWWGDPARGHQGGYKSESGGYHAPFNIPFIEAKEDDEWLTDRLTDEAIDFMERNKEQPFFVNLHFYAPHRPSKVSNKQWMKKFMAKSPDVLTGQGMKRLEEIAAYATMIESIDINVQRIIDYLDREGLRDNTIIFFTSDNGYNGLQSANNNLRGNKGHIYEGGIRVPALVNWPRKVKVGRSEVPICGMDYFPTFLDLARIKDYQGTLDGKSIVPLLKGNLMDERPLFWHLNSGYKHDPCSVIRKGDYKLIQYLLDGKVELYNLAKDLKETTNLVDKETSIKNQLLKELVQWRKDNKVPLPPASVLKY